jgi:hypothetical protein
MAAEAARGTQARRVPNAGNLPRLLTDAASSDTSTSLGDLPPAARRAPTPGQIAELLSQGGRAGSNPVGATRRKSALTSGNAVGGPTAYRLVRWRGRNPGVHLVEYTRDALIEVAPHVLALSAAEDLPAHGAAVSVRLPQ